MNRKLVDNSSNLVKTYLKTAHHEESKLLAISVIVYYVLACKFDVLASVSFAERAEGEWSNHTSQNNNLQAITSNLRRFFTLPDFTNKKKVYRRKELVGYSMQQMYAVVSDVENYKSFVPYCKKSRVFQRDGNTAKGEIQVGFPPLLESYTSSLTFKEPTLVKSECFDGRLFNYLLNHWGFSAGVKDVPNSCVVDFRVEFEFKSALHSNLSHIFFDLIVEQMESAFVTEAKRRYGKPKIEAHVLAIEKS